MMQRRPAPYASTVLVALGFLTCSAAGGCSGSDAPVGSGSHDAGDASHGGGGDDAASTGDAAGACTQADCAGQAQSKIAMTCPDGTIVGATLCTRQASGSCGWGFPSCPDDAGQACPGLGCFPQCPGGILKDSNGCDTCQCAPVADAGGDGGACVSPRGGPCGGNTSHPCTCASGLSCTPGDGGAPFGDVGGSCQ